LVNISVMFVEHSRKLIKPLPKDTSAFAIEDMIGEFSQRKHIVD
jgi:hypothetical protein